MLPKREIFEITRILEEQPVEKAWLFGSYSRDEESDTSDVDLMIRFQKPNNISLFSYIHLINLLSDATGRRIDLIEEGRLKGFTEDSFEKDKILIYER